MFFLTAAIFSTYQDFHVSLFPLNCFYSYFLARSHPFTKSLIIDNSQCHPPILKPISLLPCFCVKFILCFFPPSSKYSSFELIPFLPNPFPVLYIFKESTPFFPSFLANQHFHLHPYLILPHLSNENAKNCFFYYCPSHESLYKLTLYHTFTLLLTNFQALDTIVEKVQNTESDDIAVLLLGYEKQMREMLRNQNPGLARRFSSDYPFMFEDYTQQELLQILRLKCKKDNISLTTEVSYFKLIFI